MKSGASLHERFGSLVFFFLLTTLPRIMYIDVSLNRETGELRGSGYIDFATADGKAKAAELSGTECAGGELFIDPNVKPKPDFNSGGGFGGGRGGFGGGRGGRGGRDGGRGGGRGGRGGFKIDSGSAGKKTTFDD